MDDNYLVRLLRVEFEHQLKLNECPQYIETDYFCINILDVILDMIGVPEDNSANKDTNAPDYFCRDGYYIEWYDLIEDDTTENSNIRCSNYLKDVKESVEELHHKEKDHVNTTKARYRREPELSPRSRPRCCLYSILVKQAG